MREHTVKKVRGSEESLNAELRQLTEQTRRLREELQDMIHPRTPPDRTRAFIEQRPWRSSPRQMPNMPRRKRDNAKRDKR